MLQRINDHHMCAYLAEIAPDCSTEEEAAVACKLQCSTETGEEEEDRHACIACLQIHLRRTSVWQSGVVVLQVVGHTLHLIAHIPVQRVFCSAQG